MVTQDTSANLTCQLKAYVRAHGPEMVIRGRSFTFENICMEPDLGWFADALTKRAKYLAMQTMGEVISRPGAEPWVIMRTSGGGACLAQFAIYEGKLIELSSA